MKIGIIMVLLGAALLGAAYFSYTQVAATLSVGQNTVAASANTNVWQTTIVLGFFGLLLFLVGISVIKSSLRRKAINYVENKVGNKVNNMVMGGMLSQMPSPLRSTFFRNMQPPQQQSQKPSEPPKDGQAPPDTK